MRTSSIPITLIAGFLGAGKTSLVNNILTNTDGLKAGVIINDFGEVNIDSMLVSAQTDTSLELSNGCICCSVDEDELDDAISQLAHKGSLLDMIIIEASGLAEPRELATLLKLMKSDYAHFDTLVTVVDADNFEKNNKTHPKGLGDLEIADIVIINKVDLVSEQKLREIEQGIRMASAGARIIHAEHGQVDFRLLTDIEPKPKEQLTLGDAHDHHDHDHLHDTFTSVSFKTDKPLDPAAFEAWAADLSTNIFRAKGVVYFGMKGVDQKFIFQSVGRRYTLKLDEWQAGEAQESNLVVIGTDLDESKVRKQLEGLIDTEPENINQDTLMDVFKYK